MWCVQFRGSRKARETINPGPMWHKNFFHAWSCIKKHQCISSRTDLARIEPKFELGNRGARGPTAVRLGATTNIRGPLPLMQHHEAKIRQAFPQTGGAHAEGFQFSIS